MRRSTLALLTVSLSVPACAEDVFAWFPLQVGNRWIYEHSSKTGDPKNPRFANWTTIETVIEHRKLAEGLVAVIAVEQRGSSDGGWIAERDRTNYLIREDCVYALQEGWDIAKLDLTDEYRRQLQAGDASPDFCFPLEAGRQWGNMHDYGWRVEGIVPADRPGANVLAGTYGLKCAWTQGPFYIWFKRGTGIAAEAFSHSGTYGEYHRVLKQFTPAVPHTSALAPG
jgi:hypothetical protein